jgi:hypothetical protein
MFICDECSCELARIVRKRDGIFFHCKQCNKDTRLTFIVRNKGILGMIDLWFKISSSIIKGKKRFRIDTKMSDTVLYCKQTKQTFYLHKYSSSDGVDVCDLIPASNDVMNETIKRFVLDEKQAE